MARTRRRSALAVGCDGRSVTKLSQAINGTIRKRASAARETTGIGVLMTFMAKGALDLEDPRCLFNIGMGQKDFPMPVVEAADLIITMGYDVPKSSLTTTIQNL